MGLPWNRPAQGFHDTSQLDEEDQWMLDSKYDETGPYWFFAMSIVFTFVLSFSTSPVSKLWDNDSSKSSGLTFLRMILLVEKTRESKAVKRWAGIAHILSLFVYSFVYALSYIQTSCFEKHYSKSDAREFALDKVAIQNLWLIRRQAVKEGWAISSQYVIPCVWNPEKSPFFTLSEIKLNSTDPGYQWFALNNDAVRPDSLSFWIIVVVYCVKVLVNVFVYDDIYNQTMLPYAEFAEKHCPDEFKLCKDALIKKK
jgi:hypothetical protein